MNHPSLALEVWLMTTVSWLRIAGKESKGMTRPSLAGRCMAQASTKLRDGLAARARTSVAETAAAVAPLNEGLDALRTQDLLAVQL